MPPQPRDKIAAIVKSTLSYICPFVPRTAKNGASLQTWRLRRRARQPGSVNVKACSRACSNRAQPVGRTEKWRFGPSQKRHFAPFSGTFSSIFPVFFQRAYSEWRFGREFDLEMTLAMVEVFISPVLDCVKLERRKRSCRCGCLTGRAHSRPDGLRLSRADSIGTDGTF